MHDLATEKPAKAAKPIAPGLKLLACTLLAWAVFIGGFFAFSAIFRFVAAAV